MRLTAYRLGSDSPTIRSALVARDWMDATAERYAYRCLPLVIANSHGWEILCRAPFEAHWSGSSGPGAITIVPLDAPVTFATSHFGAGVLTFHTGYIFRTDPKYNLYVTGPINHAKDGIVALTGIVETDWLTFPFTMNWRFTAEGGPVTFEKDEPFCHIFPVARGLVEGVEPELRMVESDPELTRRYTEWNESRATFNAELRVAGSDAHQQGWQKNYVRGKHPDGAPAASGHQTRVRAREFKDAGAGGPHGGSQ